MRAGRPARVTQEGVVAPAREVAPEVEDPGPERLGVGGLAPRGAHELGERERLEDELAVVGEVVARALLGEDVTEGREEARLAGPGETDHRDERSDDDAARLGVGAHDHLAHEARHVRELDGAVERRQPGRARGACPRSPGRMLSVLGGAGLRDESPHARERVGSPERLLEAVEERADFKGVRGAGPGDLPRPLELAAHARPRSITSRKPQSGTPRMGERP